MKYVVLVLTAQDESEAYSFNELDKAKEMYAQQVTVSNAKYAALIENAENGTATCLESTDNNAEA